jgi:CubicO group peptidase (beta-lactamase class C family)
VTDAPATPFTADARLEVASVSKTITAAATLKLLHDRGVSVDAGIAPYLPPEWAPGPNIAAVTSRDLLTHESGFRDDALMYGELRGEVAQGVSASDQGDFFYLSSNDALLRVVIPHLRPPGRS